MCPWESLSALLQGTSHPKLTWICTQGLFPLSPWLTEFLLKSWWGIAHSDKNKIHLSNLEADVTEVFQTAD